MRVQTRHLHTASVFRVVDYVLRSGAEPIRLSDIVAVGGLSRFHLTRVFQSLTGETIVDFVRRVRLERAAYGLKHSRASIVDLAIEAGYCNGESFSRAFRSLFRLSPTAFRESTGSDWRLPAPNDMHWPPSGTGLRLTNGSLGKDVEIVWRPAHYLAAFRFVGPYGETIRRWREIEDRLGPWFDRSAEARCVAVFHDDFETVPPDRTRCDLCVPAIEGVALPKEARPLCIPAGLYAATTSGVPMSDYEATWRRMAADWVPRIGSRPKNTPCLDEHRSWPCQWERARPRLLVGIEMDLGSP